MTLNEFLAFNELSPELSKLITNFEMLCHEIGSLTDRENTNLMSGVDTRAVVLSLKKEEMLSVFEKRANNILDLIKSEAPNNTTLHNYFLNRMHKIQKQLKVNSSLQMHAMNESHAELAGEKVGAQCH